MMHRAFILLWRCLWPCDHEVYYMETMVRRKDGMVEATCHKCGETLVAEYGLALPAKLRQRPKVVICKHA